MAGKSEGPDVGLSIELAPELRRRVEIAAARRDLPVPEYVVSVLERVLVEEEYGEAADDSAGWAQLSARSFARDWASDEDEVYDRLP